MKYDLSILIPARNEMFLSKTIENLLENIEGKTEIIAVLDGEWAEPGIAQHPRVTVLYNPVSVGQRAATNQAAKLSRAKYVMKIDAHCAVDKGFDVKMMAEMQDDWTMVPTMYNLHAFDWVCSCGHRQYQGPTPEKCPKCGLKMEREIIWKPRLGRRSNFYRFDNTLHFQYWSDLGNRPESKGDLAETLSLQGSCFMVTREKYWELDISSEIFHSWGQQGVEVACKTWLSGGRVVVNKKTWYAHMFRTQGGDFGFPYENPGSKVEANRKLSRQLFMGNRWEGAKHPFSWLLEKFWPIPGWTEEDLAAQKAREHKPSKSLLFYTDNQLTLKLAHRVQKQLKSIGLPIVSVSLKPMNFGKNIHLPLKRGYLTMAKQILEGLKASTAEVIFFCEHDVLYHPSHFDFVPPERDKYYYNTNVWRVRADDGHGLYVDNLQQLSGLCAYRELLIEHYEKRVKLLEEKANDPDFSSYVRKMGFEPGTHGRAERVDDFKAESWTSKYPNLDIRHGANLTPSRWRKEQYRNQRYTKGWTEADEFPYWGKFSLNSV